MQNDASQAPHRAQVRPGHQVRHAHHILNLLPINIRRCESIAEHRYLGVLRPSW
jgi:hypothetical protein